MKSALYTLALLVAGAGALAAQAPSSGGPKAPAPTTAASRQAATGAPAKVTAKPGTPAKGAPAATSPAPNAASSKAAANDKAAAKHTATPKNATAPAGNAPANPPAATQQGAPARAGAPRGRRKGIAAANPAPAAAATTPPPALPKAAKDTVVPRVLMRETFDYVPDGRRDPFVSLMASSDLRPTISDLRLTGILYDLSGRRPIAIMRDVQTNAQYRVTNGMTLGRMRVARIKPKVVVFSIEEFGLNRTDSLVLGDTSRVRTK